MSLLRVCLDTNVLVSGLVFSGVPSKIVDAAFKKRFCWITADFILDELDKNLTKKFKVSRITADLLREQILEIADVYEPIGKVKMVKECPADNFVLETAWIGDAEYLVTGDKKHLLPLKTFHSSTIIDPRAFWERCFS